MYKKILILTYAALCIFGCGKNKNADLSVLEADFVNPPDSARPGVYWYFMDGNMNAEGITKDLEAMKQAGIGYVLFLEVNVGVPRGKVNYMSEEWQNLFVYAVRECERLGIAMNLGIGPGWNGSGGPWVEGSQSMQHLVYSSVNVKGGLGTQKISIPKPAPRKPFFGEWNFTPESLEKWKNFYEDVALLAFPAGATRIDTALAKCRIYQTFPEIDERALYYRNPYSSENFVPQYYPLSGYVAAQPGDKALEKSQIIDLTGKLNPDGTVSWDAPEGEWTLMRFGSRNNGAATRPAPVPGIGFEADKFDTTAITAHLEHFTEKLFKKAGFTRAVETGGGIKGLHIDSWEMGSQNWTPRFREEFTKRRGYDPLPYYPVYAGVMVDNREISERFLWDLRQTSQELIVENHVGFVRRYAEKYGLKLSIEPYDLNPASDLELGVAGDVPMCEFWSLNPYSERNFNSAFSVIEGTSAAHVIGQPVVPSESFTAAFDRWRHHPNSLKNEGDWAFAAGVNRFMYHTYANQPLADSLRPGMTMGIYGVHWDRGQTWWYLSGAYHRYVARCQYLLQQGRTVADIMYLAPEDAPLVFLPPASALESMPDDVQKWRNFRNESMIPDRRGYNFDGCPPSIFYQASVKNGQVVLPGGAAYRLIALPAVEFMTPELLKKIRQLVEDGATVVGFPPLQSPSLSDYPACDGEVRQLAKEIWGFNSIEELADYQEDEMITRQVGKGKIIFGKALVTKADRLYPHYDITAKILDGTTSPDFASTGQIRYTHRTMQGAEIYFVSSRTDTLQQVNATFRVSGLYPELWNPMTGEMRALPQFNDNGKSTVIPLRFEPYESYFIIFREKEKSNSQLNENFPDYKPLLTLDKPWTVNFDPKWGGPAEAVFDSLTDWSKNADKGIRYYSGTAFYNTTFNLSDITGKHFYLNLGRVEVMARIFLNGKDLGTVWTKPWQVDITSAAREGENELKIEVVNLWANRLIGDEFLPYDGITDDGKYPDWLLKGQPRTSGRYTFTTARHYYADSPLLPSGLLGPVTVGEIFWKF
ncbi:MAG: glycosyl hydrolase [Dysgonamonadaceae bacterium]|jgi:hypothetical protein|nr:glycosyl hydrolase [Dysgonamonadaceae bacterium]